MPETRKGSVKCDDGFSLAAVHRELQEFGNGFSEFRKEMKQEMDIAIRNLKGELLSFITDQIKPFNNDLQEAKKKIQYQEKEINSLKTFLKHV